MKKTLTCVHVVLQNTTLVGFVFVFKINRHFKFKNSKYGDAVAVAELPCAEVRFCFPFFTS